MTFKNKSAVGVVENTEGRERQLILSDSTVSLLKGVVTVRAFQGLSYQVNKEASPNT